MRERQMPSLTCVHRRVRAFHRRALQLPGLGPVWRGTTRRFPLRRFPYSIIYQLKPDEIRVIALAIRAAGPATGVAGSSRSAARAAELKPNRTFERTARQQGWGVPRRFAARRPLNADVWASGIQFNLEIGTMKRNLMKQTSRARSFSRREMLGFTGATVVTALMGSSPGPSGAGEPTRASTQRPTRTAAVTAPSCVVRPQQTEGPYFVDEQLNRSDIRSEPADGSVKEGVPVRLEFHVSRIAGNACTPLNGAAVDVWQCDALGMYSDVQDVNGLFDTRGKKFLRGYQMVDATGTAQFITIYPGWYPGRTVHIHFKIRTDPAAQRGFEFTSQLYFDDPITNQVHAQAPYVTKGQRSLKNDRDHIFRSGGSQLMLLLTKDAQGYVGTFDIGLQIT